MHEKRLANKESKKQKNIENLTRRALPELKQDAQPDNLDHDLLVYFFDRCRPVGDQEMQGLWSRVLAGEANSPGGFSKRMLNLLFDLQKADAESFTRLLPLCVGNRRNLLPGRGRLILRTWVDRKDKRETLLLI